MTPTTRTGVGGVFGVPAAACVEAFAEGVADVLAVFFFSSRRRHTRSLRDWNSDVCSSDLALADRCGTKAANWLSSALDTPARQPSAMDRDVGSGKISSSPLSKPSKMPTAADSVETFGMLKPRFISVSTGPRTTAWTVTPWPAKSALSDCVKLSAAAFDAE